MQVLEFGAHRATIFGHGDRVAYAVMSQEHALELSKKLSDVVLVAIDGVDWDRELTPWPAKSIFRGRQDFGGEAEVWLEEFVGRILPDVERSLNAQPRVRMIVGYSLAGLFAVYAGMCDAQFDGIATVSGSLWYDGFLDWMEHAPNVPAFAYCSVGDREKLGRNPVFHSIEDCTCRAEGILRLRGAETCFERRPGGHFDEPVRWMTKAIHWLLNRT